MDDDRDSSTMLSCRSIKVGQHDLGGDAIRSKIYSPSKAPALLTIMISEPRKDRSGGNTNGHGMACAQASMSEKTRRDQVRDYLVMWIDFMLWGACDERPRKERWQAARFSEGENTCTCNRCTAGTKL